MSAAAHETERKEIGQCQLWVMEHWTVSVVGHRVWDSVSCGLGSTGQCQLWVMEYGTVSVVDYGVQDSVSCELGSTG